MKSYMILWTDRNHKIEEILENSPPAGSVENREKATRGDHVLQVHESALDSPSLHTDIFIFDKLK